METQLKKRMYCIATLIDECSLRYQKYQKRGFVGE